MGRVEESLVVCDECGLAHRMPPLGRGAVARCARCDAVIGRSHRLSIEGVLALTVASAAAFLVAINAPLLSLTLRGGAQVTTLPDAVVTAWSEGEQIIAVVAGLTALLAPAAFILLRLYVLFPLSVGIKPPGFAWCVRALHQAGRGTWSRCHVGARSRSARGLADASPGPACSRSERSPSCSRRSSRQG
jgi:paraquat-inducible protein A